MPHPTSLEHLPDNRLQIEWSDGATHTYRAAELRASCPCATCREKRSAPPQPADQLTVLSVAETQPIHITGMVPVGAYAYRIDFSDGHNSGLFTIERLREMGE